MQTIDQDTGEIVEENRALIPLSEVQTFLATRPPVETAKEWREKLAALCTYYRGQVSVYNEMYEGQVRTERYIGQALADMPPGQAGRPEKNPPHSGGIKSRQQAINDLDISNGNAYRLQQLAEIPEDRFNSYIEAKKNAQEKITKTDILDLVKQVSARDEYDGDEWKTPTEWIEAARGLMGTIDLDPASHDKAQEIVLASEYYTKDENGLSRPWNKPDGSAARVWCNPPYSTDLVKTFAQKAIDEYRAGNMQEGLFLVNNCTDTGWFFELAASYPVIFSRGRVKFWYDDPEDKTPTRQGQALFYFGPRVAAFYEAFRQATDETGRPLAYIPNGNFVYADT